MKGIIELRARRVNRLRKEIILRPSRDGARLAAQPLVLFAVDDGVRLLENQRTEKGPRWVDHTDKLNLPALSGVRWLLACDIDHDGYIDIIVGRENGIVVLRNHGGWGFSDITGSSPGLEKLRTTAAVFGDFNRDGNLDVLCLEMSGEFVLQIGRAHV